MISKFFLPVFLLFLICSCGGNDNKNNKEIVKITPPKTKPKIEQKPGLIYTLDIIKPRKNLYLESRCRIGDTTFFCSHKGKIDIADSSGNFRRNITDLHCEYLVDKVYLSPLENDRWFIIWQETYHKGQKTSLAVFKKGQTNPEWKVIFPYTNAGPGVLDGNMCYFTTIGMAAKIDVSNGEMQWQVDSLFNSAKLQYKRFEVPIVLNDKIIFVDMPEKRRPKRDTLVLDPVSGQRKKIR